MDRLLHLFDFEGLLDVIVGSGVEAALDIKLAGLATDEDQRDMLEVLVLFEELGELKAVDPWQSDVEDDQIDRRIVENDGQLRAVGGGFDVHAVGFENALERVSHGLIVFDDEDGAGSFFFLELAKGAEIDHGLLGHSLFGDAFDLVD